MSSAAKKGSSSGTLNLTMLLLQKMLKILFLSVCCWNSARAINIQKILFVISMLGRIFKESKDIHAKLSVH